MDAAATFAALCATMTVATIATHFFKKETKGNGSRVRECLSCGKKVTCSGGQKLQNLVAQMKGAPRYK